MRYDSKISIGSPLHNAVTPSFKIIESAQSMIPKYYRDPIFNPNLNCTTKRGRVQASTTAISARTWPYFRLF